MESLMQLMAAKKREISIIKAKKSAKKEKYMRRGDIEDLLLHEREVEADKRNDTASNDERMPKKRKLTYQNADKFSDDVKSLNASASSVHVVDNLYEKEELTLSWTDLKKKLRDLGQPITLFGETKKERMDRLHRVGNDIASRREDELGAGHETRNDFLGNQREEEYDDDDKQPLLHNTCDVDRSTQDALKSGVGEADDDETLVYHFFKRMLLQWEMDLANRPDHIKRTAQGKIATKTMKQCKDYIRPLFKLCKKHLVPRDVLPNLVEIVRFCEKGEFVQANDAYIKLAIGNAAWPIGVTMVGIHERTGREKINSNKQAHVMNNEAQRKYITSVKRLMSYAQSITNVLPSKKVL